MLLWDAAVKRFVGVEGLNMKRVGEQTSSWMYADSDSSPSLAVVEGQGKDRQGKAALRSRSARGLGAPTLGLRLGESNLIISCHLCGSAVASGTFD